MPPAESERLRAFREAFEAGNRAWNAGDVRTAYGGLPDELEYRLSPHWPEARVLRSRDEVIAFFEAFQETFPDARTASYKYIEGDEKTLIVGFEVRGSGRASGAGTEMEIWQVWKVQGADDQLIVESVTEFSEQSDALEAAGLKEPIVRRPA
jgi:hypothetical protein